jgi:hypothetical protein
LPHGLETQVEILQNKTDSSAADIRPKIRFKYNIPIGLKIMNYRKIAIKDDDYRQPPPCKCKSDDTYIDRYHGHVISGDINICGNRDLRIVLGKGPQFRPNQPIDWLETDRYLCDVVKRYVNSLKKKHPELKPSLAEIQCHWIDNVTEAIKLAMGRAVSYVPEFKLNVQELSRRYVINVIDKARQNYCFICPNFYVAKILEILSDERVYLKVEANAEAVMESVNRLSSQLGVEINPSMRKSLPFAQMTPKFHKQPVDFRTIISSKKSCTKPISKIVGNCLSLIQYNLKRYCETIFKNTGINLYYIIDNNSSILDTLESISTDHAAKSINTFDFGQMYTNLEHSDIIRAMQHILSIVMSKIQYIYADMYSASWQNKRKSMLTISKEKLLKMIEFVVDNAYFRFGSRVYQQVVGIPMGTDCGPFIANLTLFSYEFKYVSILMKSGKKDIAKSLNNTFRYIDDITSVNDDGIFEKVYKEIYPRSLSLKKMNETDQQANVLDISVNIQNGKFLCKVYDKRDEFPFVCNRFPSVDTNIAKNAIYNVFSNELHRYFNICSTSDILVREVTKLKILLLEKDYNKAQLSSRFYQFITKNKHFSRKFGDLNRLATSIFHF